MTGPARITQLPTFLGPALQIQSGYVPNELLEDAGMVPRVDVTAWAYARSRPLTQVHPALTAATAYTIGESTPDLQRLLLGIESTRVGALVTNQQLMIQSYNNAAERIVYRVIATTGTLTHQDWLGRPDAYLFVPEGFNLVWQAPTTGAGETITLDVIIAEFPVGMKVR